jgi:hypothetical protein
VPRMLSKVAATLRDVEPVNERWPNPDKKRPNETRLPLLLSCLEYYVLFTVYCGFNLHWK